MGLVGQFIRSIAITVGFLILVFFLQYYGFDLFPSQLITLLGAILLFFFVFLEVIEGEDAIKLEKK